VARPKRPLLTSEEAHAIIEPYFDAVQETFVGGGAKRAKSVHFEVHPWVHDSPRHFAACSEHGTPILAAPDLAELPEETLLAILSHEFGHAVDFLYPAEYEVREGGIVRLPEIPPGNLKRFFDGDEHLGKKADQVVLARMKRWYDRDVDTVEATADAIAVGFTGRAIGYCGPCDIQCFDRGRPRPAGLR